MRIAVALRLLVFGGLYINSLMPAVVMTPPGGQPEYLLHEAVHLGNLPDVFGLVHHVVDVNALDDQGMTPLLAAVLQGLELMTWHLIDLGARIDLLDDNGDGVMHYIAGNGSYHLAQLLIHFGGFGLLDVMNNNEQLPLTLLGIRLTNDDESDNKEEVIALIRLFLDCGASLSDLEEVDFDCLSDIVLVEHAEENGANGDYAAIRAHFAAYDDADGFSASGDE